MMTRKDWTEVTTSVLTGAGLGAALMYLLDPESGRDRRQYIARRAGDMWEGAGESLGGVGESLRGATGHVSDSVGGTLASLTERARHLGQRAQGWGEGATDYGRSAGRWASGKARRFLPEEENNYSGTTTLLAAVGALALGAGLMYVLDPASGRRRRALIRDKATHYAHEAQDAVAGTAKDLRNRAQGAYHETRKAVGNAWEKAGSMASGQQQSQPGTAPSGVASDQPSPPGDMSI